MKAAVYDGPRTINVKDMPEARIERPTGQSMGSGQCPLKRYHRALRDLVAAGKAKPSWVVSHELPLDKAPEGYEHFDRRDQGWTKVVLHPDGSK
ncbi:MAG: hypothetical protein ACXVW2_17525 [Nocardioidaceae bacterium]